jgi:hypothetical protein
LVDIAKLALVAPAATITLAGSVAAEGMLLESVTTAPPGGAGTNRNTVPLVPVPAGTTREPRVNETSQVGTTSRIIDLVSPPYDAVIVTVVAAVTVLVVTVKFPLVAPGDIVTVAGTVATAGSLVESETTAPPAAAGNASPTVPVKAVPAATRFVQKNR